MAREDELKKESTLNKILKLQKNSSRDIAGRHSPQIIAKIRTE
jgi:hypothetical protein